MSLLDNPVFLDLLTGLLEFDPERRMSPDEILDADFLK